MSKTKYRNFVKKDKENPKRAKVRRFSSTKILAVGLVGMFLVLSLFYLFQVIGATVVNFEKQELEQKLVRLAGEKESLEVRVMRLGEINRVEMNNLGMVKVVGPEYLSTGGVAGVAMAR